MALQSPAHRALNPAQADPSAISEPPGFGTPGAREEVPESSLKGVLCPQDETRFFPRLKNGL